MNYCKCKRKSDLFDVLTQLYFCGSCYEYASKKNLIFIKYPHLKLRIKQRYNIDLTVDIYREMLKQIQDENLYTFDENTSKHLNGNRLEKKNLERHLLYIEGQSILTLYLNIKSSLNACILTALPKKNISEVKTKRLKKPSG